MTSRVFTMAFFVFFELGIGAFAATHSLVVGTFGTKRLYTLEYDDEARRLTLVAQSAHDKIKLYGTDWNAQEPTWVSYDARDLGNIKVEARIVGGTMCSGLRSIFVNANHKPPYTVYGNYYYGDARCSTVLSVHENGTLNGAIQEYMYGSGSAVHGTAITPGGNFLLSADTKGDLIWTHNIDPVTGILSNVSIADRPPEGSGPRHLTIHKNGRYVYVVFEESSKVAQYYINEDGTLLPISDLYPLVRPGQDPANYWADEVSLSPGNKYLWATNRARDISQKGYISVFELSTTGEIVNQLFLFETSSSGGFANSVIASPFDESIAALTDNSTGFVEIWHVDHGVVAHLDILDGQGCCANAVWFN